MAKRKSSKALIVSRENLKKHVAAIHTSGELSLLERKFANVLLLNAYDTLVTQRTHTLPVAHLCAMLGWEESNNINRLQAALEKLASTAITFNMKADGKETWEVMAMISFGKIEEGVCTYRYDECLAERLYDPTIYATINIGIQRRFESCYALTLYENCLRYKAVGSTGWLELELFRRIVGADMPIYEDFRRLNERVIRPAIEEINRVSDIQLTAEFQKQGRKTSAVRFLITDGPEKTLLSPVIADDHAAVRETELFKRLLEHGIGERLAILWILQDEERAKQIVEYVETKARKKQVKGTTAGYIRTLYESGATVEPSTFEKNAQEEAQRKIAKERQQIKAKRQAEQEAQYLKERTNEVINALSLEEQRIWIEQYLAEQGAEKTTSYLEKTAQFSDTLERIQFSIWLRKRLAPVIVPAEYKVWLKAKTK